MFSKQIAAELIASEATVKMHRSQVMKKMQADSLPELVRMAEELKTITWRICAGRCFLRPTIDSKDPIS
jgi:hypothetical protein